MILVDMNQVFMATFCSNQNQVDKDLMRHCLLNVLRSYRTKFKQKYGELVICCDSAGYTYWRKGEFEYYKANRKKARKESDTDWREVFKIFDELKAEFKETFPYKLIEVEGAEGDDVIAVIAKKFYKYEKVLIISEDKDFTQLQIYPNIEQYGVRKRRMLVEKEPEKFLHEHIMRGDSSDGIPNFLSDADTFVVEGKRQAPISKKKMAEWIKQPAHSFCNAQQYENYKRNKKLIDLIDCIPEHITEAVLTEFEKPVVGHRTKIMTYLITHKMKLLLECLTEF